MPAIAILGADPPAAAHAQWFTRRGWSVYTVAGDDDAALPPADLYAVCLPPKARESMLRSLLRRGGAAILLAGGAAISAAAARRLAAAARKRKCPMAVMGSWRFVPVFARLREWSAGGVLGSIREVEVVLNGSADEITDGLPAAADLACWLVDGAVPLPIAGRVSATSGELRLVAGAPLPSVPSELEPPGPAALRVTLKGTCGQAQATVQADWSSAGLSLRTQGVTGTLGGRRRRLDPPPTDPAAAELAVVAACIERGQPWTGVCTVAQAATALEHILSWSAPMPPSPAMKSTPEG